MVGIEVFLGFVLLGVGTVFHNWYVNNVDDLPAESLKAYLDGLKKWNVWVATKTAGKAMGVSFLLGFGAVVLLESIPVVGPYLTLAAGLAVLLDLLSVIRLKKSLRKATV